MANNNKAAQKKYAASRKAAKAGKKTWDQKKASAKYERWLAKGKPTSGKKGASCKTVAERAYRKGMKAGFKKAAPAKAQAAKTTKATAAAAKEVKDLKKTVTEVKAHTRQIASEASKAKQEAEKAKKEADKATREAAKAKKEAEQAKKKADAPMKKPAKKTTAKKTAKKTSAAQGTLPMGGATKTAPKKSAAKKGRKKAKTVPKTASAKAKAFDKRRKTAAGKKRSAARKAKQRAKYARAKDPGVQMAMAGATLNIPSKQRQKYNRFMATKGSTTYDERRSARNAKQKAKYALAKNMTPEKLAQNAAKLENAQTNLAAAEEVSVAVNKAENIVEKKTALTSEMVLAGDRSATENEKIEAVAAELTGGKTKLGAVLRHRGAAVSVGYNIVIAHGIGWMDSTQVMARLDNAVINKTGVGYKAFASLGLFIVGAIAEFSFHRAKTTKGAVRAEAIANASLRLINPMATIESYNLGVTRWSRPANVVRGLLNLPARPAGGSAVVAAAQGLPAGISDRIKDRMADRFRGVIDNDIDISDVEMIASKFGIAEEDQDEIFASVQDFVPFVAPAVFS